MKIAYFSPVAPQKTGIADYSEHDLLPYLSKYVDIDIFTDKNIKPSNTELKNNFNIYPYTEYEKMKDQYAIALYHMGNNHMHEYIYKTLIKHPGITIIHDIYLHGFLLNISLAKGDKKKYIDEFNYCYGLQGTRIAQDAIKTGVYPEFDYPLLKRILDNSLGVISHSEFGIKRILAEKYDSVVSKVNIPVKLSLSSDDTSSDNIARIKKDHDLEKNYPIIVSFGFISPHKRYHVILHAFKKLKEEYPDAKLLLVGEDMMDIGKMINELNLGSSVIKTGYVSFEEINNYLYASDFCVNLRYPTAGETSASVLRIMAARKPVIVSDVGWFSELPDDSVLKVDVNSFEKDVLLEYMRTLSSDEKFREQLGINAHDHVVNDFDPEQVAKDYYSFIRNVVSGNEYIWSILSEKLVNINVSENDTFLIENISEKIKDL